MGVAVFSQTPVAQAVANSFTASVTITFTPSASLTHGTTSAHTITPSVTISFTPSATLATTSATTTSGATTFITVTIVGVNSPSPAAFANALGALMIPLFFLGFGMILVYLAKMRGDFGITMMLGFFFVGCLVGMLRNGNVTTVGVIPIALTAEAGFFFITWLLAGGATRNG